MRTTVVRVAPLLALVVVSGAGALASDAPPAPEPATVVSRPEAETGLTLGEDITGEVFIRDAEGALVARIQKREGRSIAVPLEPGQYDIECRTEPQRLHASVEIAAGQGVVIDRSRLEPQRRARARSWHPRRRERAERDAAPPSYDARAWRLTLDMGGWASGHGATSVVITDDSFEGHNGGALGGLSVGYRVTPEWMVTFGVNGRLLEAHDAHWFDYVDDASFLTTFSVGARYYLPPMAAHSGVKPYVSAGLAPTLGTRVESRGWHDREDTYHSEAVFGGYVGAGVDLQPTSWLVLGTDVTYYISPKLSEPVGGRRDTNGFAFSFQVGTSFGHRMSDAAKH